MHILLVLSVVGQLPAAKVAVIPTHVDDNAKAEVPELFDDHVLTVVQSLPNITAIGQDDIDAMLGLEKQKELLGCDDVTCVAEIGGALGVDKLMVLKIARVGEKWAVTAKLMTANPPAVEGRTSNFVSGGLEELMAAIGWIVPELFGRPANRPTATGSVVAAEAVETAPPPVPAGPTSFEVSLRLGMYPGHPSSPDTPDHDTAPDGTVMLQKEYALAVGFAWQYANLGAFELLLEAATGGATVHSFFKDTDATGVSSSTGGEMYWWLEAMQLVRVPFFHNNERYLLIPSDRIGLELGVGGHAAVGPAAEAGFSARVAFYGAWFMVGAQLAFGSATNLQFGPVVGLRLGF